METTEGITSTFDFLSVTEVNVAKGSDIPTIDDADTNPLWIGIFDKCQLVCTTVGFFANVLTLMVLIRHPGSLSRLILILLRHQSLVDSWVCLLASIVIVQPYMWLTGNEFVDTFICHAWHGQAFYWGAVTLSTYNLVVLASERYLAICRPFNHCTLSQMSRNTLAMCFAMLYLMCLLVTHGTYIQTRLHGGECLAEYAFEGETVDSYFFAFVVFTYITTYSLPVVIMAVLYGLIIRTLRIRSKRDDLGHSKAVSRASAELTKTAITVTVIFTVTIGYDLHYYLLGYTGVTEYQLNTAIQKIGVFLSNLNSCANPFVYALLMPVYRRSVLRTLRCYKGDGKGDRSNVSSDDAERVAKSVSTLSTTVYVGDEHKRRYMTDPEDCVV